MEDINQKLLDACEHEGPDTVKKYLDLGADIYCKDIRGNTVLHTACNKKFGNTDVITFLLEHGCKPDEKNEEGETALHVAVTSNSSTPNSITSLMEDGFLTGEMKKMWRTVLQIAHSHFEYCRSDILTILIENGVNPNEKDKEGRTALHVAADRGFFSSYIITNLLKNGCKPDERDKQGKTPYMIVQSKSRGPIDGRYRKEAIKDFELALKILKKYEEYWQLGLPPFSKQLDKHSATYYASLLVGERYEHYEARVMLAGEQGTGKTTIARYLVGNDPTKIRISTDGIDLYNGLSFIDRENKEWLHGKQGFTLSEVAISRSLRTDKSTSTEKTADQNTIIHDSVSRPKLTTKNKLGYRTNVTAQCIETKERLVLNDLYVPAKEKTDFVPTAKTKEDTDYQNRLKDQYYNTNKTGILLMQSFLIYNIGECPMFDMHIDQEIRYKSSEINNTTEVVKNPGIIGMLKKFFGIKRRVKEVKVFMTEDRFLKESLKVGRKKLHQRKLVPVIIWDFGGQDVFYSTHQTFLTYRAIYLIVLDGSRTLDDPCPSEQYLPGKSGHKTARDYLKFWITTIVTYCKGSVPKFPKIIIVLTHKDKLNAVDVELKRQQLFHDIEKMFSGSSLLSHLVITDKIFVNARNKNDPEMAKISNVIIEQAMKQPTWGQKHPKCFIPLELEFDFLLNRNISLITMDHMKKINKVQPVRPLTEEELKVFLKFQHAVGRILYFDETNLDQYIILAPTHLIDAFKSIVTDRSFCEGDGLRQESWDLMSQKGVISKRSIDEIWKNKQYKKFHEHKEYLLGVMTHLDILVEPKRYDISHKRIPAEFYFIASMVRTENTTGYLESPSFTQRNIAIAFISSSSMIPPALSFRFVSYCLSLFAVKTYGQKDDEMLFHMSAVFTIDPSLDMCVRCDDDIIVVHLVHSTNRALITRDLASSIRECLAAALEKISQLYVKTSSTGSLTGKDSFNLSLCCSSPVDHCLLPMIKLEEQDETWICRKHGIEHTKDVLSSWALQKEDIQCGVACPATDTNFLRQFPKDIHLRRLSIQYSVNEARELAIHLGMQCVIWERLYETFGEEPERLNFETLRRCVQGSNITFNDIRVAVESGKIQNPHTLCKVVRGQPIDFDQEPEKWDLIPSEEHFDKLAPLVGNNSLAFLVELGMEFATWEQIQFKQNDRDLVKLNLQIMQAWKSICNLKTIRPSLRHIGQAFNNIGKNIKIVENALADFF